MEAKEVLGLIGKEVWWIPKEVYADIDSYEKGWVTIRTDDEEVHKVRAKDIMLMDSDEELVEKDGEVELIKEDPTSDSSGAVSGPEAEAGEISCSCGEVFTPPKQESFKCPACGKWHRVRLHPDLDKYVKGMDQTASGRDTVDIDDHVATILRGFNLDELYKKICTELETLDPNARFSKKMAGDYKKSGATCSEFLEDRYGDLNPGMQRMNLGNLLRGAMKRNQELERIEEGKAQKAAPEEATVFEGLETEADGTLTESNKKWIDEADVEQLLRKNRFAPLGDPMMIGESGDYFIEVFNRKQKELKDGEFTAISKRVGWDK